MGEDQKKAAPRRRKPKRKQPPAAVSSWSPATDSALTAAFSSARPSGKTQCKAALQAELGLKPRPRTPIFLYVGELERAAGFDLVLGALPGLSKVSAQVVVMTPRRGALAAAFEALTLEHPDRLALLVEGGAKDETLLRRALAGSDMLLLPGAGGAGLAWRGLRYGALPVALAGGDTGALLDSLSAGSRKPALSKKGTAPAESLGFLYRSASALALGRAAQKAVAAYREAVRWRRLRNAALRVPELDSVAGALPSAAVSLSGSPVMTLAQSAHQFDTRSAQGAVHIAPRTVAHGAEPTDAPYVDWGPPPPTRYGEDALELLVQSPRRLYGYWEIAPARSAEPGHAHEVQLVLHEGRAERLLASSVADFGDWWIDAEPDREYRLELRSPAGVMVLESARVRTPREDGSPREEAQFVTRPEPARGVAPGAPRPTGAARVTVAPPRVARRLTAADTVRPPERVAKPAAGSRGKVSATPAPARAPKADAAAAKPRRQRLAESAKHRAPASEERPRKGRDGRRSETYTGSSGAPPRGRR
ncbi:MAG: hypothetical protein ABI609_00025 [Acidobacteriota bacterium]